MTERNESYVSYGRHWSAREIDLMMRLHEVEGKSWAEVGDSLDRTAQSCSSKYAYERAMKGRVEDHAPITAPRVPQSVLIERDQRLLAPRSLSAMFFGDPPQGFSALEGKGR